MPEQKMVLFMPWCPIGEEYSAGGYRLIPFDLGEHHTGEKAKINRLLKPYRTIKNEDLQRVCLVQVGDGPITRRLNESEMKHAFDFAEYSCFCSLSERTAHYSSSKVNRDCFTLHAQGFEIGNPMVVLRSRRLGGMSKDARNVDELFISAPTHCDLREEIRLNSNLLISLAENYMKDAIWLNAIECFNRANTDSDNTHEYFEFILLAGAFDRILSSGRNLNSKELAMKFENLFEPFISLENKREDIKKWENIKGWFLRFWKTRNGPAHGDLSRENFNGWEILVTAKLAFPLLLKILLNNENQYELSDNDVSNILHLKGRMTGSEISDGEIFIELLKRKLNQ